MPGVGKAVLAPTHAVFAGAQVECASHKTRFPVKLQLDYRSFRDTHPMRFILPLGLWCIDEPADGTDVKVEVCSNLGRKV
jgi:hypothetical protein